MLYVAANSEQSIGDRPTYLQTQLDSVAAGQLDNDLNGMLYRKNISTHMERYPGRVGRSSQDDKKSQNNRVG
jgi:hypothetical protein